MGQQSARIAGYGAEDVPNSLLVAARVDFRRGLDEADLEQASAEIDDRIRAVVPDVTEVFLDATTASTARQE